MTFWIFESDMAMKKPINTVLIILFLLLGVSPSLAQQNDALEDGKLAFREGRFDDAVRNFERVTDKEPENAEAHYLLARVYFETPMRDEKKARRSLDKALDLEPENVQFLVARLRQLRTESWNFFSERIKETKRLELSRKILDLDPENAFANEELGSSYIRDFWRYRNAIMMPTLSYGTTSARRQGAYAPVISRTPEGSDPSADPSLDELTMENPGFGSFLDPNQVFIADKFDMEKLKQQGVPVSDLSARAQRAYEKAIGHLETALQVDPRRRTVYDKMMEIYSLKGEYEDALDMLKQMYQFFPEDGAMWRYLGLSHYKSGNMAAAEKSYATAFKYMEEDEALAYQDISLILPKDETGQYEDDPIAFSSRFWTSKDPRYLTTYNERKLEHYSRLTYADLLYGSPGLDLRGWETQRGHILVRYGLPKSDVVIIPKGGQLMGRQALAGAVYSTINGVDADGNPIAGDPNVGGERETFTNIYTSAEEMFEDMNTYNIWEYGTFRFVFEDPFRNGEYRMYTPPATDVMDGVQPWINDYVIRTNETFRKVPDTYDYEAPGRQIELPYIVTAFKGLEDQTDLYVHYGIPVESYDPETDMIEITANAGTFLISEDRDILVERRRTVYGLPTEQIISFEEQSLWVDTQIMDAPPGNHEVSVEFETASGGTVAVQRRDVEIPDFSEDRLLMSDLMLAYRVEETDDAESINSNEIIRNGLSILPAPWSVFSSQQPIYIYFEAYNLQFDANGRTDYEVEVVLKPKDQSKGVKKMLKGIFGGEKGVSVSYQDSGSYSDEDIYQLIDATDQEAGLYTIEVSIRDNISKKTVNSEQDIFLEN